jgi:tetratricopeptide (TPR) repeat protein
MRQFLTSRVEYDPASEDALYILDRCSGGLYPADVSLVRIREAAAHFGPREGQTLLRRPVEFYRCLVNLGATLISNALYDEARNVHGDLERLIEDYTPDVFPRVDLPRMNNLLGEYRSAVTDAEQAAARQREIASSAAVDNDPFYPRNALAVYLALAERHDEALAILDQLDNQLSASRVQPEASMVYLIRANRCAVRFCAGAIEGCEAEWATLADLADAISYPSRPIYVRRHELLADVMAGGAPVSALAFDEVLLARHPDESGPLWKHYGYGFMLPAIEIWREN